jgi:hypothetical protein
VEEEGGRGDEVGVKRKRSGRGEEAGADDCAEVQFGSRHGVRVAWRGGVSGSWCQDGERRASIISTLKVKEEGCGFIMLGM